MRISTIDGEVELTAEMVTRGMVFSADDRANAMTIGDGSHDEEGQHRAVAGCDAFLGCDPTIASRADCERFGVRGDAAEHGFARLRGGGALDMRRESPMGTVCYDGDRRFIVNDGTVPSFAHFLGLNASACEEDIDRLCCGAGMPIRVNGVRARCTLAIGDHDVHEDLLTGVRWRDPAPMRRIACSECHAETLCPNGTYHHDHCPIKRRAREAPIVALVNAVPEGLDPIGWRAAALAGREYWHLNKSLPNWPSPTEAGGFTMFVSRAIRGTFTPEPTSCAEASLAAYRRAIAPAVKVTPERKQRTSSIRLPDDDDFGW